MKHIYGERGTVTRIANLRGERHDEKGKTTLLADVKLLIGKRISAILAPCHFPALTPAVTGCPPVALAARTDLLFVHDCNSGYIKNFRNREVKEVE
jgi:hypothetical protein